MSDPAAAMLDPTTDTGRALLENLLSKGGQNPSMQFYLIQALAQTGARQSARWVLQQLLADQRPFPERSQAQALLNELTHNP